MEPKTTPARSEGERKAFHLFELAAAVDNVRFEQRLTTKSAAMQQILRVGLKEAGIINDGA